MSVPETTGERHYGWRMILVAIGISWNAICYSYSGASIASTLGQPSFLTYMGLAERSDEQGITGTATGLFYAGGVFGCLLNSWMADRYGRKRTVIVANTILLISSACLSGSVSIAMFIVFRFFIGLSAYMLYLTAPLWVVELVPPHGRSITAGIVGLCGVIGYILAAYVGVGFFYLNSSTSAQWRAPLAIGCAPTLVSLAVVYWLPESPRWLLRQNKSEEAWVIVKSLHMRSGEHDERYAEAEFLNMTQQSEAESLQDGSWSVMLKNPLYRRRTVLVIALPAIIYSTGNLVITTYAASIFGDLGYDSAQSLHLLAGIYVAAVAGNLLSLTYVDRVPRNILMSAGCLLCTVVLAIETALISSASDPDSPNRNSLLSAAAAFIFLFLFAFNTSLEGPSWYYASEIFPTRLRAKGMTANVTSFCLINLLWLELAPTAFATIGWKFYLVFICIAVVGAAFIFFTFPDSLKQPLEKSATRRRHAEGHKKRINALANESSTPAEPDPVTLATTGARMQRTPQTTTSHVSPPEQYTSSPQSPESVPGTTPLALLSLLQNYSDGGTTQEPAASGPGVGDISFSVYRFLCSGFLLTMPQDDIKYLDDQACLRVPRRDLMDGLLELYFRHIHPILPLFNEGEFWAMYRPVKYASLRPFKTSISLFVLHAMLFACCSFVPVKKLQCLGFESARHARKTLYRRAKLLYWFGTDDDQVSMAQGALLLSLWCPQDNDQHINTWWLSSAIQHARTAQAHCYRTRHHLPYGRQLELKRLWWTCIIRDRVMGLALRQPILITPESFDFEPDKLSVEDLKVEEDGPSVYETDLKRVLLLVTVSLSDLCIALTNVLMLVSRQDRSASIGPEQRRDSFGEVKKLRDSLWLWHKYMGYHSTVVARDHPSNNSVIVFSNLLQIYFHSALIMLANYEIQLEIELDPSQCPNEGNIDRNKEAVQESTVRITQLLQDLMRLDLVKYLPTSAVTCTAHPLVLYLLDQTLAHGKTTAFELNLAIVLDAMKVYQCLYDHTDLVLKTAYRISLEARSVVRDRAIKGWADVLSRNPKAYLRFIVTMDVALAKGSFPGDSDFPWSLQKDGSSGRWQVFEEGVAENEHMDATGGLTGYLPPTRTSAHSSPHIYDGALVIQNTECAQDLDPIPDAMALDCWTSLTNREPQLMESEIFLQNLLESYISEGTGDVMGSLAG
ncbi:hypothetical protein BDV06DRAFT_225198 [Aspergillus oleicola]